MHWWGWVIVGLVIGSMPFGVLIGRSRGVDIRKHGSGNIGATNVARVLGWRLGALCFVLDVLKGAGPTFAMGLDHGLLGRLDIEPASGWAWMAVFVSPVLGHMFSPWLGFRGGKGVATSLGSLLVVFPALAVPALGAGVAWGLTLRVSRYVGLSSCVAAVVLPVLVAVEFALLASLRAGVPFLVTTAGLGAIIIVKHRGNLARALRGTEPAIGARVDPVRGGRSDGPEI